MWTILKRSLWTYSNQNTSSSTEFQSVVPQASRYRHLNWLNNIFPPRAVRDLLFLVGRAENHEGGHNSRSFAKCSENPWNSKEFFPFWEILPLKSWLVFPAGKNSAAATWAQRHSFGTVPYVTWFIGVNNMSVTSLQLMVRDFLIHQAQSFQKWVATLNRFKTPSVSQRWSRRSVQTCL